MKTTTLTVSPQKPTQRYGLAASIFTQNLQVAHKMALASEQVRSGSIATLSAIARFLSAAFDSPVGARAWSRTFRFTETKAIASPL